METALSRAERATVLTREGDRARVRRGTRKGNCFYPLLLLWSSSSSHFFSFISLQGRGETGGGVQRTKYITEKNLQDGEEGG